MSTRTRPAERRSHKATSTRWQSVKSKHKLRGDKTKATFPKAQGSTLLKTIFYRVFLWCSGHNKSRACNRQRRPTEPAGPLHSHLSLLADCGPLGCSSGQEPTAQAHTCRRRCLRRQRGTKFWKEVWVRNKSESGPTCRGVRGEAGPGLSETGRPSRLRGTRGGRCLCGSCARAAVFVLSAPHMV